MQAIDEATPPGKGAPARQSTVRSLVLVSGACLAIQVIGTDYGAAARGTAGFWFIVGAGLLWLVYRRRSRAARVIVIVTSLLGAIVYSFGAFGSAQAALLCLAYLGQALPMMSRAVRSHTRPRPVDAHR